MIPILKKVMHTEDCLNNEYYILDCVSEEIEVQIVNESINKLEKEHKILKKRFIELICKEFGLNGEIDVTCFMNTFPTKSKGVIIRRGSMSSDTVRKIQGYLGFKNHVIMSGFHEKIIPMNPPPH